MFRNKRRVVFAATVASISVMMQYIEYRQNSWGNMGYMPPVLQLGYGFSVPAALLRKLLLKICVFLNGGNGLPEYLDHVVFFIMLILLWIWVPIWARHLLGRQALSAKAIWASAIASLLCGVFLLIVFLHVGPGQPVFPKDRIYFVLMSLMWGALLIGSAVYEVIQQFHRSSPRTMPY
jgi:hypothetical protein